VPHALDLPAAPPRLPAAATPGVGRHGGAVAAAAFRRRLKPPRPPRGGTGRAVDVCGVREHFLAMFGSQVARPGFAPTRRRDPRVWAATGRVAVLDGIPPQAPAAAVRR